MRVLVASDAVGPLTSRQAGAALGAGWPRASVRVVPVGAAGAGFVQAAADLWDVGVTTGVVDGAVVTAAVGAGEVALRVEQAAPPAVTGLPLTASSAPLGAVLLELLDPSVRRVHLDLTGLAVHDGGAGLLAALGARADVPLTSGAAGLHGIGALDLEPVRRRLAGVELVGVAPPEELAVPLLGLRGATSRRRDAEPDPAVLLRTDADLGRLAELAGPGLGSRAGAGACGGLALAVLALGGRLSAGPALGLAAADLHRGRSAPDLLVTGCSVFDFAARGGGVVAAVAAAAAEVLAPCVVVAGEVLVGSREMRTMGIESAYAVRESTADAPAGGDVDAAELTATAHRVARSWSW